MDIHDAYQHAIHYAGVKHADQRIPDSEANYLLHLSNVAMEVFLAYQYSRDFDLGYAIHLALLHDVLEDTSTDFSELVEVFGSKVAVGVKALTKDACIISKEQRMVDSLKRISSCAKEVALVKLADRITNLQPPPSSWTSEKIAYYRKESLLILHSLSSSNQYLSDRLNRKIQLYGL